LRCGEVAARLRELAGQRGRGWMSTLVGPAVGVLRRFPLSAPGQQVAELERRLRVAALIGLTVRRLRVAVVLPPALQGASRGTGTAEERQGRELRLEVFEHGG
jgi:hypothetical protein